MKSDEGMEKVFIIEPERKIYSDWIINGCTFFPEPYGKIPEKIEKVVLIGPVRFMNILDSLEKVKIPVLIFRGSNDTISKREDVEILLSHLKERKYIECEKSGYACYLEKP